MHSITIDEVDFVSGGNNVIDGAAIGGTIGGGVGASIAIEGGAIGSAILGRQRLVSQLVPRSGHHFASGGELGA
jgi:outer membrane lipoprotein SlyB